MRPLLPYEKALIETLNISEADYFEFRRLQAEYSDPKQGTVFDIRNDFGVTALVLTVVGVLFQVGAALLAPRPNVDVPTIEAENAPTTRDQRFSPRYGFESAQELARFGDPINLVYTSTDNPYGGVRVNTSLLYSAVYSNGGNQYAQLMGVVGAGIISSIDPDKTAFGQTLIRQFVGSSAWLYFSNVLPGDNAIRQDDLVRGDTSDPFFTSGVATQEMFAPVINLDSTVRYEGFSQSYSPASAASLGLINPVPINVNYTNRTESGEEETINLGIRIPDRPSQWPDAAGSTEDFPEGSSFTLEFVRVDFDGGGTPENREAQQIRSTLFQSLELGGIYKLGAARFQLTSLTSGQPDLNGPGNGSVVFQCIESGPLCSVPYGSTNSEDARSGYKSINRIFIASYETVSQVRIVHFAIKARVFMFVSGRQPTYGETNVSNFSFADNGYKNRAAFFTIRYRKRGDVLWTKPAIIFCIRRAADNDYFIPLTFLTPNGESNYMEFEFEPVVDLVAENIKLGGSSTVALLSHGGSINTIDNIFFFQGSIRSFNNIQNTAPPLLQEWTLYSVRSDTNIRTSFDNGPEISITAVSEQQVVNYAAAYPELYQGLCLVGLNAYSSQFLTSLKNLSVFVTRGKVVRQITNPGLPISSLPLNPSSYAPDIFLDTLLDDINGVGRYTVEEAIDVTSLYTCRQFCIANGYYMDGVIADPRAWRQFWAEVAPYSLLELAKIGGKETLVPAVPYNSSGQVSRNITPSAIFNQGNILEGTYKEQFFDYGDSTQDLIATIVYRDQSTNDAFARSTSVTVSKKGINEAFASKSTFDLSSFVTSKSQAINYAMLLINQRQFSTRAVEFQTFPTEAPVQPGSYIIVHLEDNQYEDIRTGSVTDDGTIILPYSNEGTISGTAFVWKPGGDPVTLSSVSASILSSSYKGSIFVLGTANARGRVFRVVSVSMEEEGEVTINAIEHQCDISGSQLLSKIANFDPNLFDIDPPAGYTV